MWKIMGSTQDGQDKARGSPCAMAMQVAQCTSDINSCQWHLCACEDLKGVKILFYLEQGKALFYLELFWNLIPVLY